MRILVLGGTVFLSREVALEAVRRGHDVVAACRGASGALPDGVRHVPLDRVRGDAGVLAGAGPFDAVVDVARNPAWVRAAVGVVPDAHWVFVSSISAYADHATPGGGPGVTPLLDPVALAADEDAMATPELYGAAKVACERAVLDGAASAFVVRPGLVSGPGDPSGRFAYWPARLADVGDHPEVLAPGSPDDVVQIIDVRDLASWIVDAAGCRTTGVVDGVGPQLTRGELIAQVAAGVGVQVAPTWVPQEFLLEQRVEPWAGPRSVPLWLPLPDYAGMLAHDPAPAAAAGLVSRPLAEVARDTLAWLRRTPDAAVAGLTRAEEAEVLAAWRSRS
ncbi:Rossmann-fold NAD(P)-binding domain-containing protein [Nocardioides pacificus]